MHNCGQDLPPKMQLGFAIGNVVGILHRKCGWDSPLEWWRRWPPPRIGEVLWTGREDHRQGYRDITGKGKGYAASGSEESYVDLFQHTMSFSHLERSPMKRRWDCSCAVLSFSKGKPSPRTPWHHRKRKGLCCIRKWRIVCWLVSTYNIFLSPRTKSYEMEVRLFLCCLEL